MANFGESSQLITFDEDAQMRSFQENIQKWVRFDNQTRLLNEKIREIREKKSECMEALIEYSETNKISDIQISDGRLKFTKNRVSEPLTFKYLEKSLTEIIRNTAHVNQIMEYIKKSREIKVVQDIKRFS
jgi:hypothetical protein